MEELERQAGISGKTVLDNARLAEVIPNASFHNANFSSRIWMHQDLLKSDISKLLQSGLIQGKNPRVLARELQKTFSVKISHAERLMRTELARVQTEAQKESFKRNGFDEFMFIANKELSEAIALDVGVMSQGGTDIDRACKMAYDTHGLKYTIIDRGVT